MGNNNGYLASTVHLLTIVGIDTSVTFYYESDGRFHGIDQFPHGGGGFLQGGLLFRGQFYGNDLLHAAFPQLYRHADKQVFYAVFSLQVGSAQGRIFFLSFKMASAIATAAEAGA